MNIKAFATLFIASSFVLGALNHSANTVWSDDITVGNTQKNAMIENLRNEYICVETGMSVAESARENELCPTGNQVLEIAKLMIDAGWNEEKINTYMSLFVQGQSIMASVDITGQTFTGNPNAPVTMIEFTDIQCPFCGRYNSGSFPDIKSNYIETGKLRYVQISLPLPFHIHAAKAAEALYCADEQEKFWEFKDKLFENQNELTVPSIKEYAVTVLPNVSAFSECLDNGKYTEKVAADASKARDAGIFGTPGFIIGSSAESGLIRGRKLSGAQPAEAFTSVIDKLLK